jgi:hypothetical protein
MENQEQQPEARPLSRQEKQSRIIEEKIARLREVRGLPLADVKGYVYRETWEGGRQALPPVEDILYDHEIGLRYGPGKYMVTYHIELDDGTKKMQSERYNIGPEYLQLHLDDCQMTGRRSFINPNTLVQGAQMSQGGGLMDLLTEEKAKGLLGILGALKMVLGNGGQNDQVETLKAVLDGNNKVLAAALSGGRGGGGLPSELITLLFDRATKPQRQENSAALLRDQLDLFKEIQVISNPAAAAAQRAQDDEETERSRNPMEKMIEKALEYLPGLLEKFNGNETAAAQHLKKTNFIVSSYLKKPDVARAFFDAVSRDHGQAAAERWAAGFGFNPSQFVNNGPGVINL